MLSKNRMKNLLKQIALLFFFLPTTFISAQVSFADSIRFTNQLIRIEQQLMDDVGAGVKVNWEKYMHKDCFIVTEDGIMLTKETFLNGISPFPKGYSGHINVIKPKTVFYNNTAIINFVADEYENVFLNKIHTTYNTIDTYIKNDTSWLMVSLHIFEIPQLPPAIAVSPSVLEKYIGIYQLSDSIACTISLQNDTLFYQRTGRARFPLFAEMENVFFRTADARGRKLFMEENGIMLMRERRNGQDVTWKRIRKPD